MESKASESNELGAVQYVSEITGADIKTVANWFIFMLIFVFDPLAITLVIATNQAFEQRKPKVNIYGEPKPIEPEPVVETSSISREMIDQEKNNSVLQRLGFICEHVGYEDLATLVEQEIKKRTVQLIRLSPGAHQKDGDRNARFKLIINDSIEIEE